MPSGNWMTQSLDRTRVTLLTSASKKILAARVAAVGVLHQEAVAARALAHVHCRAVVHHAAVHGHVQNRRARARARAVHAHPQSPGRSLAAAPSPSLRLRDQRQVQDPRAEAAVAVAVRVLARALPSGTLIEDRATRKRRVGTWRGCGGDEDGLCIRTENLNVF